MSSDVVRDQLLKAVEDRDFSRVVALASQLENLLHARERRGHTEAEEPVWSSRPRATGRQTFLVTGGAGFIGSHVVRRLLEQGHFVVVVDDFNDYYNPVFKYENVAPFLDHDRFALFEADIRDRQAMSLVFDHYPIEQIIHLAARAGVRPSIRDPQLYITSNVLGTQNLLDLARDHGVRNFVYASSSSVYGGNTEFPFSETQIVDHPVSPYAATKKANEVQAACYNRLYGFPVTGLRFFTVYGPSGRPDMAIRMFIESMDRGEPIPMFGDGSFERDFTYVDDIVDGIMGAVRATEGQKEWHEVFNLGESDTTTVRELILLIAKELGKIEIGGEVKELSATETEQLVDRLVKQGLVVRKPEQPGDVPKTFADVTKSKTRLGYAPHTRIAEGIRKTVAWHRDRQARTMVPKKEQLGAAASVYASARRRCCLDSEGRWPDPLWNAQDLDAFAEAMRTADRVAAGPREFLALRIAAGLCELLTQSAAYLGGIADGTVRGLDALAVHRDRKRLVALIRAGGFGGIAEADEAEILSIARRVVRKTGERPTALVVAAAGYGSRIADEVGGFEMKHRLFLGDEMLLLSLRNFLPYSKRVIAVVSEKNRTDVAALLARSEITVDRSYTIEYVIQKDRLGDGDAHLCAAQVLSDFEGVILFLFADAPTKSPETIEKMVLIKQALGEAVPLVIPCFEDKEPYSPIVLAGSGPDRGRVIWNWQKADEADYPEAVAARKGRALRNVGIFAADASIFKPLERFKQHLFTKTGRYQNWQSQQAAWQKAGALADAKPKEPEFGFADLMKVLAPEGIEVAAACLAKASDKLNVNKHEDAEAVKSLYRERYPFCQPMIERVKVRSEVIVRFYDLGADRAVVRVNGLPSVRNYTRLGFTNDSDFRDAEIQAAIDKHIQELSHRIERELGLKVLPAKEGVVK
jgi:UDP-glucuronate 4-epimerase